MDTLGGLGRYCAFLVSSMDFLTFLRGKAQMRKSDFFQVMQESGPMAVPIVCLLSPYGADYRVHRGHSASEACCGYFRG